MLVKRDLDPSEQRNGAVVQTPGSPDAHLMVVNVPHVEAQIADVLATEDAFRSGYSWLDLDLDHRVVAAGGLPLPASTPAAELLGLGVDDLNDVLARDLGGVAVIENFNVPSRVRVEWDGREFVQEEWNLQRFECRMGDGSSVVTFSVPRFDPDGTLSGTRLHVAHLPAGA